MQTSILSLTVVAAIVTTCGTLFGHVVKEIFLARSFEQWKQKRTLDALYRKYRDPLVLSALEFANRLIEILEEHPADYLAGGVLGGPSPEPSHDAERDRYFLRYKYQSTVYRLAAFLGWLELYRQDLRARKYNQAATGYLVYGVVYLAGAIYLGQIGKGPNGGVWWYVFGAAMAFGLPCLIWKRFTWVTRILAVLVLVRVIGLLRIAVRAGAEAVPLPWGGEIAMSHGAIVFMLIALTTSILLARAVWQRSAF